MKKRIKVTIYRSNNSIEAQAIDGGKVISGKKYSFKKGSTPPVSQALGFGENFGKILINSGVKSIKFDRGSSRYHGRVKSFADGMRKAKVNF